MDFVRCESRSLLARVAMAAALWCTCLPDSAAACSVCLAGDPVFSSLGASAQQAGDLSVFVQLQAFEKTAGVLAHAGTPPPAPDEVERADDQRLDLFVAWSPLDRLTLTLDLPFAFNEIFEDGETHRASGVGDLGLSASVVAWRDREVLPSAWVEARAFVEAPTGDTTRAAHGEIDPHLQPGTGSWDLGVGLAAVKRLERAALYASLFYRENRSGDFGHHAYEYGDAVLATAALELPLGHALARPALEPFTLGAELDFRFAEHDRADGARFAHSGGSILYATPSLRIRLPFHVRERPASLRAAVQIPLTSAWLHGTQREDEVWSFGLYLPL
ncbi:MAG TPA: hypothetical protein VII78_00695 [Myxococcota bacterium]